MKYKNKNTGEVRDFACTLKGNVWEPMETKAPVSVKEDSDEKPVKTRRTLKK